MSSPEDIADRLDDLICTFDNVVTTELDTVVILLLGWLAFGAVVFVLSHVIIRSIGSKPVDTQDEKPTAKPIASVPPPPPPLPPTPEKPKGSEEIVVRVKTIQTIANGGSSGAAIKPPGRKSPVNRPKIPQSVGSDREATAWVNSCIDNVYGDPKVIQELIRMWLDALSEYTVTIGAERHTNELIFGFTEVTEEEDGVYNVTMKNTYIDPEGLSLKFTDLLDGTRPPVLSNVTTQYHPSGNMTITADLEASLSIHVTSHPPPKADENFTLHIDRLRGRANFAVLSRERLLLAKLDGWPEVRVRLTRPDGSISVNPSKEERTLFEVVKEVAVAAIRGTQVTVNMEDLVATFPVFNRQTNGTSAAAVAKTGPSKGAGRQSPKISTAKPTRSLSVRVVKASQLTGCIRPYVIVEVDEPYQREKTQAVDEPLESPQWNQDFAFSLSACSGEVLFEVWDAGQRVGDSDAFLGLGIVAVEELLVTPSQRHVIPLQGRPFEDADVVLGGLLTVQFVLVDPGKPESNGVTKTQETRRVTSATGQPITMQSTKYEIDRASDSASKGVTRRESYLRATRKGDIQKVPSPADVAQTALEDLASRRGQLPNPSQSTMILHGKQSTSFPPSGENGHDNDDPHGSIADSIAESSIASRDSSDMTRPQSRGRRKRRNLISTFKKRFSGAMRSSSLDQRTNDEGTPSDRIRSASEIRGGSLSAASSYLAVPLGGGEDASSLSDVSGISNASNKTYITEESSLVLETLENGTKKHYLIPHHIAVKGKIRKRGTKLHIYMDHVFVAKHIKGGTLCEVCHSSIPLRIGKQGYICRDCSILCHKECHIKVPTHCLETSLPAMELEYYDANEKGFLQSLIKN